ncbi:MAG TPA: SBBP repeat-containing protein, partial [Hymenobacter sp.]
MKLFYTCLYAASLLGLANSAAVAQAPAWSRVARIGGAGPDAGEAIAVDATGNTYVAGRFNSASITIGSTTLNNAGAGTTNDMFVAKYSPAGAVLWATRLGGSGDDVANGLTVDGAGNVFV